MTASAEVCPHTSGQRGKAIPVVTREPVARVSSIYQRS
jgi:hypothetical protein